VGIGVFGVVVALTVAVDEVVVGVGPVPVEEFEHPISMMSSAASKSKPEPVIRGQWF